MPPNLPPGALSRTLLLPLVLAYLAVLLVVGVMAARADERHVEACSAACSGRTVAVCTDRHVVCEAAAGGPLEARRLSP